MGRIEKVEGGASSHHHNNNNNNNNNKDEEEDLYGPPPPPTIISNEKSKLPPTGKPAEQFTPLHHHHDDIHQFHPPPENIDNNHYHDHQPESHVEHLYSAPAQAQQPPPFFVQSVPGGGGPIGTSPAPAVFTPQIPHHEWKTHLFDCMSDPQNAIITLCFPCVTFGQIAEILDDGRTSCGTSGMLYTLIAVCIAMPCLITCSYRSKMRAKFGLIESPAPDCLIHCFCEYCALCQEYRELTERGIDPSIGYYGNVAKIQRLQQQMGMAAPMQQRMI